MLEHVVQWNFLTVLLKWHQKDSMEHSSLPASHCENLQCIVCLSNLSPSNSSSKRNWCWWKCSASMSKPFDLTNDPKKRMQILGRTELKHESNSNLRKLWSQDSRDNLICARALHFSMRCLCRDDHCSFCNCCVQKNPHLPSSLCFDCSVMHVDISQETAASASQSCDWVLVWSSRWLANGLLCALQMSVITFAKCLGMLCLFSSSHSFDPLILSFQAVQRVPLALLPKVGAWQNSYPSEIFLCLADSKNRHAELCIGSGLHVSEISELNHCHDNQFSWHVHQLQCNKWHTSFKTECIIMLSCCRKWFCVMWWANSKQSID